MQFDSFPAKTWRVHLECIKSQFVVILQMFFLTFSWQQKASWSRCLQSVRSHQFSWPPIMTITQFLVPAPESVDGWRGNRETIWLLGFFSPCHTCHNVAPHSQFCCWNLQWLGHYTSAYCEYVSRAGPFGSHIFIKSETNQAESFNCTVGGSCSMYIYICLVISYILESKWELKFWTVFESWL